VFKASGWVRRKLSPDEYLRLFDMSLKLDEYFSSNKHRRGVIAWSVSPLVLSAMFRALWEVDGGVEFGIVKVSPPCGIDCGTYKVGLLQLRGERYGGAESLEQSGSPGSREQTGPRKVGLHDREEIIWKVQQQH